MKIKATNKLKICTRCVMDNSDSEIFFNKLGICNHCIEAEHRLNKIPKNKKKKKELFETLIKKIKTNNNSEYDCVIGLSGGIDSSYLAYIVKLNNLKPLAVHVDNGWNTELSVRNINNLVNKLDIDLYTNVLDWESFRDLQLCFLHSSLPNCEAPTDHAITATLFSIARKYKIRYIISGGNLATESIMPKSWGHYNQDLKLLLNLHKLFGKTKLQNFPTISLKQYLKYVFIYGMKQIPLLNFLEYNKEKCTKILENKFEYKPYKFKHGESIWTRFFQNYYLPTKYGFDKRKAHLSSMICSKQLNRKKALSLLKEPLYNEMTLKSDMNFILKKLNLSKKEFDEILKNPKKEVSDYPSHKFIFDNFEFLKNIFRAYATKI